MKYVLQNSKDHDRHWDICEKNKDPFIVVSELNKEYKQIFYDISNYKIELEDISNSVKSIYKSYIDFFLIPYSDVDSVFDQYYFFYFIVKSDHAEYIANALFDFLQGKLKGKGN